MRPAHVVIAALALLAAARPVFAQDTTQAQARRITLDEALRLAAQTQPTMVQARENVRVALAGERQARANYLPSISASGSTSRSGGARAGQTGAAITVPQFYSSNFRLGASLNLFTGFQRGALSRAASATADLRQGALLATEYNTALATKQAFFAALADRELVAVSQTSLRMAQSQVTLATERLRLGAATRSDSLTAAVQMGSAQLALIQAQANLLTAQANLGRAVGSSQPLDPVPDTTLEIRLGPLDTAALRNEAMANAPSIRQADAAVTAARAQVSVARSQYWPQVTLSGSNTWLAGLAGGAVTQRDSTGKLDTLSILAPTGTPFGGAYLSGWNVSLTISLPIFNNYQREYSLINNDAAYEAAIASARDARLALDASLTQDFAALNAAGAQIDVARVSNTAAQENLRLQQERYRLGASTILDVLTSEVAADQAAVNMVQARYSYLVARAQLEAVLGHSL